MFVFLTALLIIATAGVAGCVSESASAESGAASTPIETPSLEEIKNSAMKVSYDDLFRLNENYLGDIVYYRGEILQSQNIKGETYIFRIATKKSEYLDSYLDDVIYVHYTGSRLLVGDIVDVWGRVKGLKSYTTVLGSEMTIPEIEAIYISHLSSSSSPTTTKTPSTPDTAKSPPTPNPSRNDPEVLALLAALESAEALHGNAFTIIDTPEFSLPYDYTIVSYRKNEEQKIRGELRDLTKFENDIKKAHTQASNAKPPNEYAISKAKIIAGINSYSQGVRYIKQSYDLYLEGGTYATVQRLHQSAYDEFWLGEDYLEEARSLLP